MKITEEELKTLSEYYDTHDTSDEMENGEWIQAVMPPSVVKHYVENLGGLGDSYDDYRIDHAARIVSKMYDLFKSRTWVDIHDFNKVVDNVVGESYDDRYWDGNW
jgi:hypothetical protein